MTNSFWVEYNVNKDLLTTKTSLTSCENVFVVLKSNMFLNMKSNRFSTVAGYLKWEYQYSYED